MNKNKTFDKFVCILVMIVSLLFMFVSLANVFYGVEIGNNSTILIGSIGFILFGGLFTYWTIELTNVARRKA